MQQANARRGYTQENKNRHAKLVSASSRYENKCHSQGVLSGMPPSLMGFTLIELLVVVLIIGILAAVALPQYNKAVKKAQGREVLVALDALDKALHAYALENGGLGTPNIYGPSSSKLNIQIPTLKYFKYKNVTAVSFGPTSTFEKIDGGAALKFVANSNDASVSSHWEDKTGERRETICSGNACNLYFQCNLKEEPYYPCGGPNRGCDASGTTTNCYLD